MPGKSHSHPPLVKQRQLNKDENGKRKSFLIRVVQSSKLSIIVLFTNLKYRERERQRKRESRRQASEAQREKGRQTARVRDKKRRHFSVGRTTLNMKIL